MENKQYQNSLVAFSLPILIAAILAGGIIHYFPPLESFRPSRSLKEVDRSAEEEKVYARMWQDPFQAVESAIKEAKDKCQEFDVPSLSYTQDDFYEEEFVPPLTREKLCNEIKQRLFQVPLRETFNTIGWLNEVLTIINLKDVFVPTNPGHIYSEEIRKLTDELHCGDKTEHLNNEQSRKTKRLNRLLLEENFPNETPRSLYPRIFASQDNIQKILVMPVMVSAGPSSDQTEERLRHRYALLSALHVAGYKPKNPTHIGVFKTLINNESRKVPYECYLKEPLQADIDGPNTKGKRILPHYDAVVVLWLGNEYFSENRLEEMESIRNDMVKLFHKQLPGKFGFSDFEADEFKGHLTIEKLCNAIAGDICNCITKPPSYTLNWLNDLLKNPRLYETLHFNKTITSFVFFKDATDLANKAKNYISKPFPLDLNNQIKKFNRRLLEEIYPQETPKSHKRTKVFCKFIGPPYSSNLVDIYKQLYEKKGNKRLELYSPWANADRHLIEKQIPATNFDISKENISFTSTLHDYSKLTKALVKELVRRHVDLSSDSKDHTVIINEWDSFYGRTIPVSFVASVKEYRKENFPNNLNNTQNLDIIHSIAYLGGVDGKLHNREFDSSAVDHNRSNQNNNSPKDIEKLITKFEQPQGQDQYDYIQRISAKVKNMVDNPGKIKAIGVMGVDVYDKLLILRALHDEFPNALFFTTDLDARLWHYTELPFTRNLIVASSYGLQLNPKWQRDIPPFRSTHQTSFFVAALQALRVLKKGDVDLNKKPHIYEIGRQGAYDITPTHGNTTLHPERLHRWKIKGLITKCSYLLGLFILPSMVIIGIFCGMFVDRNTRSKWYWIVYVLVWIGVFITFIVVLKHDPAWLKFFTSEIRNLVYLFIPPVLVISCFIWPFITERKDPEENLCFCFGKSFWLCFWIFWTLCFALFAALAMASSLSGDGEPITFLDSISIWPTELIRLFNGFLATYYFSLSCQYVKHNNNKTTNSVRKQFNENVYADFKVMWEAFSEKNDPLNWKRLLKIMLISGAHLVFGYMFIFWFGTLLTPGRGDLCFGLDKYILFFSLFLMYVLHWHIVFNTFKCRGFIRDLTKKVNLFREEKCHTLINIIAKKTEVEARMIKYPFILLLVVCISRYSFIDNWNWTISLVVLLSLSMLIILCTAILLFREAATFRQKVVDQLNDKLVKLITSKQSIYGRREKGVERDIEFTKFVIEDINNIKTGAFAPLSYNPILLSTLMSSGGMGIIGLLQKYV